MAFSYFSHLKAGIVFALLFILSCRQKSEDVCRVIVRMSGTSADSVIVRKIPLNNEVAKITDSGLLRFSRDSMMFELPLSSDSLYQISLKFSANSVYCIPDALVVNILMNKKNGKTFITGSPASASLLKFNEEQDSLLTHLYRLHQNDINNSAGVKQSGRSQSAVADIDKEIQQRYYNFEDTVSSSAAFLLNFDHIDFKNDLTRMQNLLANAFTRFPKSSGVARLNKQVLNLIHIRDTELQVGDLFPELQLPDLKGNLFSTITTKGKYAFIDFWSSWCPNCLIYDKARQNIKEDNHFGNLVLIHVALDDHLSLCREIVENNKMSGIQLIDTDIWQGQTSEKLAFDSIPFNFLLSPDHRILAKAIPADSVLTLLKKYIR